MAKISLQSWIQNAMVDETKTDGKGKPTHISMISCVHVVGTSNGDEVGSVRFGGTRKFTAKEIADMFRFKAQAYSQDLMGGVQLFKVLVFHDNGDIEPVDQFPFRINVTSDELTTIGTEAPTPAGQIQQGMRHLEVMTQTMLGQIATLFQSSNQTMSILATENQNLRRENTEAFTAVKDMVMLRIDEEKNRHIELEKERRASAERQKWLSFLPALANQVFGKDIFPQSTADTALIETLAESIPADKVEKFVAMLSEVVPPEHMGLLMGRLDQAMKDKAAKTSTALTVENAAAQMGGD